MVIYFYSSKHFQTLPSYKGDSPQLVPTSQTNKSQNIAFNLSRNDFEFQKREEQKSKEQEQQQQNPKMSYVIFKQDNGQYKTKTMLEKSKSQAQTLQQQQQLSKVRKNKVEKAESSNGKY